MVLITGELNSSIKNARLEDKLIEYKKKNIFDIVEVNQVISYTKSEDWSTLVVNERSKHIASVLVPILLDLNHRIVI